MADHSQHCAYYQPPEVEPEAQETMSPAQDTAACQDQTIDPNTGLPVGSKTSEYYLVNEDLPNRFDNPDWFKGYGTNVPTNPMYRTTASDIGRLAPNVHTMPTVFWSRSQMFTNHLGPCGMYRNHSLNTAKDTKLV